MSDPNDQLGTLVVCEDDDASRELLCENLAADRYDSYPAATAKDALRHCRYHAPGLLLLDLGLPDGSGLDVLRRIRASIGPSSPYDPALPVIILSGRGAEGDRIRGLREGADDYLVKPFSYLELLERVEKRIRRGMRGGGPVRIENLVIDRSAREVHVDGTQADLSAKEFELLRMLASEPRRVFTKEELLAEIWGFPDVGRSRTLDSHASRLRRKLDPADGRFVKNCWGVGYRLVDG